MATIFGQHPLVCRTLLFVHHTAKICKKDTVNREGVPKVVFP